MTRVSTHPSASARAIQPLCGSELRPFGKSKAGKISDKNDY